MIHLLFYKTIEDIKHNLLVETDKNLKKVIHFFFFFNNRTLFFPWAFCHQLKLQYFGHLMWRTDPWEKTLMLEKI